MQGMLYKSSYVCKDLSVDQQGRKVRRQLYDMVRYQAEHRLGPPTSELKKYQSTYEKELKGTWKSSPVENLMERVLASRLLILGDFHGIQQSQKSHLRLLKKIRAQQRPIILGVECLEAKDSALIHKYLKKQISESAFLEKVKWHQKWGFPWENYKPLFHWVHDNGGTVCGINKASTRSGEIDLKRRDEAVATHVTRLLSHHKKSLVVVIFGEMHLATPHLIKALQSEWKKTGQNFPWLRVFQNPEQLFFNFLEQSSKVPQLVKKNESTFALLSVPPWVKWQSYLIFLERSQDSGLLDDEWDDDDEYYDHSDEVAQMIRVLATDLKLPFNVDHLAVATLEDASLERAMAQTKPRAHKDVLKIFIRHEVPFLIPKDQLIYLPRMSVNHAAQTAMLFLAFAGNKSMAEPWVLPRDFLKLVWVFSWVYFGSKLLNPRRKADTFKDLKARLGSRDSKEGGKEALK
ncbi:MAG: ChaN family lipoprotein, partial [Bdellovibrionota bacterium]